MLQKQEIKTLSIRELLKEDHYIIPLYQRNYAWGNSEIELLLNDLSEAYKKYNQKKKNYYIGSLVVYRREDNQWEVIDGQQRLTTFTILKAYLNHTERNISFEYRPEHSISFEYRPERNISFEYRQSSDFALDNLFNEKVELPSNFKEAVQAMKKYGDALKLNQDDEFQNFINFIWDKVKIIRTEVPPQTDLNHYFEIMNTRGEQLEKHEILKARFMSHLQTQKAKPQEISMFANIWDARSDMQRYMVMGFEKNKRGAIFGNEWGKLPESFDAICINQSEVEQSEQIDQEVDNSIAGILNGKGYSKENSDQLGKSERFNSVIDFSNFLMHVLRVFKEQKKRPLNEIGEVSLDEKVLLDSYKIEELSVDDIKSFAFLLLKCRYLFDCYVIKSDASKGEDDHWSLYTIKPNQPSYQFNNTFGDTDGHRKIIMLLSMFHVSHPSRIYKNWLYAVLRWLNNQDGIKPDKYIEFLEDLSDRYYFGQYGRDIDFFKLITDATIDISGDFSNPSWQSSGTSIPNFIFNRLDYLLWKNCIFSRLDYLLLEREQVNKFRFTFRSSVEHFYPQTPINGEDKIENADYFGNLCLISSSMNSKFSNNMPQAKAANFTQQILVSGSLKLAEMLKKADIWNKEAIDKHGKEMINLLNTRAEKTS